jgi:hypothetical protein
LGTTVINPNYINEEIKSRLNSENACYHCVQKLFSKILQIKIYKSIILPVVLFWCGTFSLTLREEHRFRVLWMLRRIFGSKRKWQEARENCKMRSFITCMLHHVLLG